MMKITIKPFALFALLLLFPLLSRAGTVEVKTNIWTGTQVMDNNWSNYVVISAAQFINAESGQSISVHITAVSPDSPYPQLMLNNGSWGTLSGTAAQPITTAPTDLHFIITPDMLSELQQGGLIVKGVGYTLSSVDLIKQVATSDNIKGNPEKTVWRGSTAIDWTGTNGWQTLSAQAFMQAKAGYKLRFHVGSLRMGAQGHLVSGSWGDLTDATAFLPLSSNSFEYTITDAMLAQLQQGGCIVTGVGFTLNSVTLLDPTEVPLVTCSVDQTSIKVWEADEQPQIGLTLRNLESYDVTTNVFLTLRTDKYEELFVDTLSATLGAGETQTLHFPLQLAPGIYHAVVSANYSELQDFNIAIRPTDIVSPPDMQSDFQTFWNKALADLAAVAPQYKLTKIDSKSTSKRNVYLVEMQSVDNGDGTPVTIRGYYAEPVAPGTYPVVISQNGYDSDATTTPYIMDGDSNPEWIELIMSNRGQLINNRTPYQADNIYGDWFQYHFGNRDTYYYRGAYMDVVRSIDFIASRQKAQQQNIFMQGGSQGGAFTLAGAALDHRLNAIAPSIPFMGDFPDYFQVGNWPAYPARQQQTALGMADEEMYRFLSYFDTKNLATLITCPVILASGLQDPVCPPHTHFAPYNNLGSAEKQLVVYPQNQHATPAEWYGTYMDFFKRHLSNATGITHLNAPIPSNDGRSYNLAGQQVDAHYRGIVIKNGKKTLNR